MESGISFSSDPTITFFSNGPVRKEALDPIVAEAERRGYDTVFEEDLSAEAEVGIYNEHTYRIQEVNAALSVIGFHSIDCPYKGDHWIGEPWDQFDIGFVPGAATGEKWVRNSWYPKARPDIGLFEVGWPKSDDVFSDSFQQRLEAIRTEYRVPEGSSVMFTPSYPSTEKLREFLSATEKYDNRLVKLHPSHNNREIAQGVKTDDVIFLDENKKIMECLSIADVSVSDESSVIQESILTGTIPVSVTDWMIGSNRDKKPSARMPGFAIQTPRSNLGSTLSSLVDDLEAHREQLLEQRDHHFANVGSSAAVAMDVIEAVIHDDPLPVAPLEPEYSLPAHIYGIARANVVDHTPEALKDVLRRSGTERVLQYIDDRSIR
ncbi:CDP-glycerol glycerophosphotransferase family protein [Natrarchaeobius chitinivorans]|uniref:Uncharacterized protein n=1 Tax=Natrarchaeobius chitinivorans TaxID=1679083 RepID=A0A3N6LTZ0_NATCH|nr:CDP-glycerol glycerophosphotransferase family protein [Natrarchaeobius chitinivorans]RQG92067.1 hypothetical protein EA473_17560 [Natrarchaeobius chitinivorans]